MGLIYVASVYSQGQADAELRQKRYEYVRDYVGQNLEPFSLLGNGVLYSPIVHNHELAKHHNLPKTWDFWRAIDLATLKHCEWMIVLKMPGWENSVGITAEIEAAKAVGMHIRYVDCPDYKEE